MRIVRTLRALIILFGLFSGACTALSLPTRGLRGGDAPPELAQKPVVGKEPPTVLIAEDGTRCVTSRDRFERTRIGSEVWCVWTGSGADAGRAATLER